VPVGIPLPGRNKSAQQVEHDLLREMLLDLPLPVDPEVTEVLPGVEPNLSDPPTEPLQTSAIPPTPRFQARRPDQDHGHGGPCPGGTGLVSAAEVIRCSGKRRNLPRDRSNPSSTPPPTLTGRTIRLLATPCEST
jgi:hypothetical protein